MIKHSLKDSLLYISIANLDFSYRIPIQKIGNTIDWRIGEKGRDGIVIQNVSIWTLQLFTKKTTENKYVIQFENIVKEHCPDSTINWEDTLLAVNVQNQYNWLVATNKTAKKKIDNHEIMSILKKKYKLD